MNHINHHGNNIPAWKVLQERKQDPFHFIISRPQPVSESSKSDLSGKRMVIPSKRAAQNRAAQKAFRQRRDQYIKELETKANEVKETQSELTMLREENGQLRERVIELERQVAALGGKEKEPSEKDEFVPPMLNMGFWHDNNSTHHSNQMGVDLAFDPFLDNSFGLMNNELFPSADNDQVLDDLFAVLQTRQRPLIPALNELENN
ncbi:unnamed protein product [Rhizopus stolonifer]